MKAKYLLPYSWRPVGWLLILFFVVSYAIYRPLSEGFTEPWSLKLPCWLFPFRSFGDLFEPQCENGFFYDSYFHEVVSLALIAGLIIVGFSKVRVEDERIAQMRLEALQWGVYANYIVLSLAILLVYGSAFLSIMMYNMFTPLLIFVLRFYWLLKVGAVMDERRTRLES